MKILYICLFFSYIQFTLASASSLDLIIFSFDRPMQLYALLQSIKLRWQGISGISVLYRASSKEMEKAYNTIQITFADITFTRHYGKHDFQGITTLLIKNSRSSHIFFGVDDIIVTDDCDLSHCLHMLEATNMYCFALRLGKNITECYTENLVTPPPSFTPLDESVLSFTFGESKGDWDYPHSLDMSIYRKSTVMEFIEGGYQWCHPNHMEGAWSIIAPKHAPALCFTTSKIVNVPMNVVNVDWESRNMRNYSPVELTTMFNNGLKIDINCVYKYTPRAPHEEIDLKFIHNY